MDGLPRLAPGGAAPAVNFDAPLAHPVFAKGQGFMRTLYPTEIEHMESTYTPAQVYFACLASYNNGHLHGCWVEPIHGVDHMRDAIAEMLETSPIEGAEEWAVHDYEGYEGAHIEEYAGLEHIYELTEFIEGNSAIGAALLEHYGNDLNDAWRASKDQYAGTYESVTDFVREITEETTIIPENLRFYIDYEAMAQDMLVNDVFSIRFEAREYVFWQR